MDSTEPVTILFLYYHPPPYNICDLLSLTEKNEEKQGITQQSPLYSFMYALKSSEATRQYPKRLKMLFDFLGLSGSLEEQANEFLDKARQNIQWSQDSIMKFLDFHKQRVRRKELAADNIFFRFSIRLTPLMVSFVETTVYHPLIKNH